MVKAAKRKAAARAREGRAKARLRALQTPTNLPTIHEGSEAVIIIDLDQSSDMGSDCEQDVACGYTGGVNYTWSDTESESSDTEGEGWADEELTDLEEDDLPPVQPQLEQPLHTPSQTMFGQLSAQQWADAEANRALGYNGLSRRTQQRKDQKARKEHEEREKAKAS